VLDEGRNALHAGDFPGTQRWLTEARAASADAAGISGLEAALAAARTEAKPTESYLKENALTRTRYVAPRFPDVARARGIDGWVDVQFTVAIDGTVGDLKVVGAEPAGIFEQAALDAVRHWRYLPVVHDGHAVSELTRVRLRFTVQR
jgi:TonB family protein